MIFSTEPAAPTPQRAAIAKALRGCESDAVRALLAELDPVEGSSERIATHARRLVAAVRAARLGRGGLDAFLHEYGLSSHEGVLLMCIAEALLRVPDEATQERLIRDKLSAADWDRHLGQSPSLFVNASTWALMLTGRVVRLRDEPGRTPGAALRRLVARIGEPVVREAVTQAMRIMGRQFVMGRTVEDALERARPMQARGYRYSYDMLGESARTMADAERYFEAYRRAIAAIGASSDPNGSPVLAPGISVKLSALHPRYETSQSALRLASELLPRVRALARDAAAANIGLTLDAEEADRLDLCLDVIEGVCADADLAHWQGFGVVVQAYLRAAPALIDALGTLAAGHRRRLMVRLVKGAYWDAEIKRTQELGLDDYPVFTRKASTDVSFLACARRLLARRDLFYPQIATHNAHSIAAVLAFAGPGPELEFQRLHGMGEALYEQLVEKESAGVGCRIYAPVGRHEDLLAYLVRRLLENGANSSFVNRIQDDSLPIDEIIADPIATVRALAHVPHPRIPRPRAIYLPQRLNSRGVDLASRAVLADLARAMRAADGSHWSAGSIIAGKERLADARECASPADRAHVIGRAADASEADVGEALAIAGRAAAGWAKASVDDRARCLERAADLMEAEMPALMALCVREAGKTLPDAVAEVREAADFCRYYAARARRDLSRPLSLPLPVDGVRRVKLQGGGVFACISPWNFPLAIFSGQIAAALVAGNAVVAKPAEQTPLIAAEGVRLLHRAGIPPEVLHLLPGDGARIGGTLVADERVAGVAFTGSAEVAQLINRTLSRRSGRLPPLIAETGGQNAMIVDSTALPEQVTRDAIASAFQSAGQRCSALRVLFLQEDVAERIIDMLAGALDELVVGDPVLIETDVGPVIDEEARTTLARHVGRMLGEGRLIRRARPGRHTERGCFLAPAIFEIDSLVRLQGEVFGPVLHVVRYRADRLPQVVDAINATGFGLTLGIQTRIDETWRFIFERARVGNTYVNRNQIGAIVGVQPFGGQGRSGTGPKAGGPHYLHRLVAEVAEVADAADAAAPQAPAAAAGSPIRDAADLLFDAAAADSLLQAGTKAAFGWGLLASEQRARCLERAADAFEAVGGSAAATTERCAAQLRFAAEQLRAALSAPVPMPGPTGERNELWFQARGLVLCVCPEPGCDALVGPVALALAGGNTVVAWHPDEAAAALLAARLDEAGIPAGGFARLSAGQGTGAGSSLAELLRDPRLAAVVTTATGALRASIAAALAAREGTIVPLIVHATAAAAPAIGTPLAGSPHAIERMVFERTLSIDTTASGGNASLLSLAAE